jgi:hypothetical protein
MRKIVLGCLEDIKTKFNRLNPKHKGEPLLWALELAKDNEECRNAALLKLAMDVEIPNGSWEKISNEAVYEFLHDTDKHSVMLFALVQRRFGEDLEIVYREPNRTTLNERGEIK